MARTVLFLIIGGTIIVSLAAARHLATPGQAQGTAAHPRLLFFDSELPGIRQKVRDGFAADDTAYSSIIAFANTLISFSNPFSVLGSNYGFNNIPTLAIAYQLSDGSNPNKNSYRDKCKEALLYHAATYEGSGGSYDAAVRLYVLSLGFDMCFDAATAQERATLVTELEEYLTVNTDPTYWDRFVWSYRPYTSNGSIMISSSTGMASIVLRGETSNTALLDAADAFADTMRENTIASLFDPLGAYTEGVLYAGWAMRFLVPYIEARQRYDGVNYAQRPEIANVINWLAYGIRPHQDNLVNNLNDTLQLTYPLALHNTVIDWAMTEYNSGVAMWLYQKVVPESNYGINADLMATALWHRDIPAVDPDDVLPKSQIFPHRGLYYYRTGWPATFQPQSDDSVFSLYSGKFYGGHAQEDQGQFTLFSKGEHFITDTGYGNLARQSEGHNLVFIDGFGQHTAGSAIGTDGNMVTHLFNPFADFVHSDNKAAYDTYSEYNENGYPFPSSNWSWGHSGANPVLHARRYALSVKPDTVGEYFVLSDDIEKDGANHNYDWILHTKIANTYTTTVNPVLINGTAQGNKLEMHFVNPAFPSLLFSEQTFDAQNVDGNTRRLLVRSNAVNPHYFVILFPKKVGAAQPTFTTNPIAVTGGQGAHLDWSNSIDDYVFSNPGRTATSAAMIDTDGRFTLVRKDAGQLRRYLIAEGTSLHVDGQALATITGGSASVASNGQIISVSDPTKSFVLYGPAVGSVTQSDGTPVPFAKEGDYVYINSGPSPDLTAPAAVNDLIVL